MGVGGVVTFSEELVYPPYWKNNLLAIPFNRSLVLGSLEVRGINIPCHFLIGSIERIFRALPNRKVVFYWKTDGRAIWGALRNCFGEPQQILPRQDVLLIRCHGVVKFQVPDQPILTILAVMYCYFIVMMETCFDW